MGQLQIKRYKTIVERMRNRVVARTALNDLTDTGSVNQVLSAAAREDDDQYFQMGKLLDLFDLDTAVGDDLDEVGKAVNPDIVTRRTARKATGVVVFSRVGTTGAVSIPQGTLVQVPATGATAALKYQTTAEGTILDGNNDSASVPIVAQEAGSDYNVDPNTVTAFGSAKPSGVDSVANPAIVGGGLDIESDDAFRARIKLYLKSLSRGTPTALVYACLGVEDTATGKSVAFAATVEDVADLGNVIVYIDDGSGTAESTTPITGETVLASAVGGETDVFLLNKPVKHEAGFTIYKNASPLTGGVDFVINPASGQITFTTALIAADAITADYTHYTGLIQECQKIIDGDVGDRANYPGYRAAGVLVRVLSPQIVQMVFTANIIVAQGWSQTDVANNVASAISGYINGLTIGEDVILNELRERAMVVPGMYDIVVTEPSANRIILDNQLARILDSNITLA